MKDNGGPRAPRSATASRVIVVGAGGCRGGDGGGGGGAGGAGRSRQQLHVVTLAHGVAASGERFVETTVASAVSARR